MFCNQIKKSEIPVDDIINQSQVTFVIDERTEFFWTIFNLTIQDELPKDLKPCQTDYLASVNAHFLFFKEHPLISWIYDVENIGVDFSTAGLLFKNLETFELDSVYANELEKFGLTEKNAQFRKTHNDGFLSKIRI